MSGIVVDGQERLATGAYAEFNVESSVVATPPPFNVGVLIAQNYEGKSYNVNDGVTVLADKVAEWKKMSQVSAVQQEYGIDSEMAYAFQQSKNHGLSAGYLIGLSENTQVVVPVKDSAGSPATVMTLTSRKYGARWNDLRIIIASNTGSTTFTVIPPKQPVFAKANVGIGDLSLKVNVLPSWLKAGASVYLSSNDSASEALIVLSVIENKSSYTVNGKAVQLTTDYTINFTTASVAAHTVANNARLYQPDTTLQEVSEALATLDDCVSYFNNESSYFTASKEVGASTEPASKVETEAKSFTGATASESPAPTSTSITDLVTNLPDIMTRFKLSEGVDMRLFCVVWGAHTDQVKLNALANARREAKKPISIVVGGSYVAIDPDSATLENNPKSRAQALNSENIALAIGGWDGYGAYKTLAPAVWGKRIGSPLAHNLTGDELLFTVPQVVWGEELGGTMDDLLRAGCLVYSVEGGFSIEKGQNTLQEQAFWNPATKRSYLIMQRDLADYVIINFPKDVKSRVIGFTDKEVTANDVKRTGKIVLDGYASAGYIKEGRVTGVSVDSSNEGWIAEIVFTLPNERNYFLAKLNLIV